VRHNLAVVKCWLSWPRRRTGWALARRKGEARRERNKLGKLRTFWLCHGSQFENVRVRALRAAAKMAAGDELHAQSLRGRTTFGFVVDRTKGQFVDTSDGRITDQKARVLTTLYVVLR